jgi:hypothetical protein
LRGRGAGVLTAAVNYVTPDMDGFGHGVRELDLGI